MAEGYMGLRIHGSERKEQKRLYITNYIKNSIPGRRRPLPPITSHKPAPIFKPGPWSHTLGLCLTQKIVPRTLKPPSPKL